MLRTFLRFTPVDYCIETQEECLTVSPVTHCEEFFETSMIAKAEDTISFILDKTEHQLFINAIHLRAALTSCGVVNELSIANISESDSQYFISCFLPDDVQNGEYEITIYKNYQMEVLSFTPESSDGACDATFTVAVISPPAVDFEFSVDLETWNDTGVFTGLCMGDYTIYVRETGDGDCASGSLEFEAALLNCADYKGFTLQQFIDSGIFMIQLKDCTIEDLAP